MNTLIEKSYHCERCKNSIEETFAQTNEAMIASVIFVDNDRETPLWKKLLFSENKVRAKFLICRSCFDVFKDFLNNR